LLVLVGALVCEEIPNESFYKWLGIWCAATADRGWEIRVCVGV